MLDKLWNVIYDLQNKRREVINKMLKNVVAETRKKKNLKQEELAEMAGISRQTLSAIENGTIPNGNTMINIAKVLNEKVEDLFYEDNVKQT